MRPTDSKGCEFVTSQNKGGEKEVLTVEAEDNMAVISGRVAVFHLFMKCDIIDQAQKKR